MQLHEYSRVNWVNAPSVETPLSAENLNQMDNGIAALYDDVHGFYEEFESEKGGGSSVDPEGDASLMTVTLDGTETEFGPSGSTLKRLIDGIHGKVSNVSAIHTRDIASIAATLAGYRQEIDAIREAIESGSITIEQSHVGMIIHSTTLATMQDVIAIYGGTTWIRHEGYFLRGARENDTVTADSATQEKDANGNPLGAETVKLTAAQSGVPAHSHPHPHTHGTGDAGHKYFVKGSGSFSTETVGGISGSGYKLYQIAESQTWGNMTATGGASTGSTSNNTAANASQAHNNMPPYKNVYIWERTE